MRNLTFPVALIAIALGAFNFGIFVITALPRVVVRGDFSGSAVEIEQRAVHPIPTILEGFRGPVSMRTHPKSTSETH